MVQIISKKNPADLIEALKKSGYKVTNMFAQGTSGPVKVIFTVLKRKELNLLMAIVKKYTPRVFYSISDARSVSTRMLASSEFNS